MVRCLNKYRLLLLIALTCYFTSCVDEESVIPGPTIYFPQNGIYEIALTDTFTLTPKITYDYGSTYMWEREGEIVSNDREYIFIPGKLKDYNLKFSVSNDKGGDTMDVKLSVLKGIDCSKFDNFTLPKKQGLRMTSDTLVNFVYDNVVFNNVVNSDTTMWGGFAFCNITSTLQTLSTKAMGVAMASTSHDSYLSANCEQGCAVIDFGGEYIVKSMDVAMDNFAYLVSKFGLIATDSTIIVNSSGKNDYVRLHVLGLNENDAQLSDYCFDLVDCRYSSPTHYVRLADWKTLKLVSLGKVRKIMLTIESSQENFPPLVCIDNLKLQDE